MMRLPAAGALLLCSLMLAACSDSDVKEVKQWMADTKAKTRVAVPSLVEPKTFVPFAYKGKESIDPYSPAKLMTELAKVQAQSSSKYKSEMERRKELLETFPLDTVKMVGSLQKGGTNYALLQIDRAVYQVTAGQHLGQNYGLITSVTENALAIREIVQDASGEWVERMSKLELQESKETKK